MSIDYLKSVKKIFKKSSHIPKPNNEDPNVLTANGHDICNYIARYGIANFQIQTVLKIDGRLDFDKLLKAVRLSVDVQPVLGCRFIAADPPYWKRFDNIDEVNFCSIENTDNSDEAVQRFLESPLDMDNDPMVKVRLIRSNSDDTLCIKLNHTCSDGAGTKQYIQLLSEIYSHLDYEDTDFVLQPIIRNKSDEEKLFSELGIKHPSTQKKPSMKAAVPMWNFPWRNKLHDDFRIVACRIPSIQMDEISKYGKSKGATVNDLILTAFYRAMFKMSEPIYGIPMHIQLTVDLRRFLPDKNSDAIRNFSGGIDTKLVRKAHEPFDKTLSRVMYKMNKAKNRNPGLPNALAAERVEKMNFHHLKNYFKSTSKISKIESKIPYNFKSTCAPGLSNVGIISKSLLKFGDNTVIDAYIVAPAVRAPGFLLIVSTYNGIMTLSTTYYRGAVCNNYIEKLLNKIKAELIKGCTQL